MDSNAYSSIFLTGIYLLLVKVLIIALIVRYGLLLLVYLKKKRQKDST